MASSEAPHSVWRVLAGAALDSRWPPQKHLILSAFFDSCEQGCWPGNPSTGCRGFMAWQWLTSLHCCREPEEDVENEGLNNMVMNKDKDEVKLDPCYTLQN